ncbi:Arylalkylamine N-acetyltransferase [Operophtera brumata]|uniref:Arylalkylamine N-acetyltransferase n=1 Tax=Operophtera brumata TaxID=104452 RepID=A0A0L7L931_OPEBR|nr:Arylalkylamine N-acetyltransferase [Operophtera brumata]
MAQPSYSLCRVTPDDKDLVLKFLRRCEELEEYAAAALDDLVSVAAVDENGDFVGIVVNGIARREFRRILKVLCHLDREARMWEKLPENCHSVLEIRIASTHTGWRGRGLMRVLCEESECTEPYTPTCRSRLSLRRRISKRECISRKLDEYCTHSMLEGLSFKAVDGEGNIVGAMISGVCPLKEDDNGNDLLSQAERCTNKKFQKILYILARREAGAKLWEKFPQDKSCVEIKVAATDPAWRRKGIMNKLKSHFSTRHQTAQNGHIQCLLSHVRREAWVHVLL